MSNDDRFADAPISRRRFFQLSGATGAALALPGNATATTTSGKFTEEYEYVLNHTPADHAVPTLVQFDDADGPAAMEAAVGTEVITTTEPEPAAYGTLTSPQSRSVADLPEASTFQFAPGSNPFWRIGYYPLGVFPEPRRSVDYIGFEQLKDGLAELEDRYPDRIRVKNVGKSPGHENNVTDRPDPKGMYVVELTNFDSETDFEDKEKVFFSCSLHGLEMASRET
ncbi:peptidase M14, partial [Halobacteriales archaeon QH_7_69_31]